MICMLSVCTSILSIVLGRCTMSTSDPYWNNVTEHVWHRTEIQTLLQQTSWITNLLQPANNYSRCTFIHICYEMHNYAMRSRSSDYFHSLHARHSSTAQTTINIIKSETPRTNRYSHASLYKSPQHSISWHTDAEHAFRQLSNHHCVGNTIQNSQDTLVGSLVNCSQYLLLDWTSLDLVDHPGHQHHALDLL